jgi:hypothetical protein
MGGCICFMLEYNGGPYEQCYETSDPIKGRELL